MSHAHASCGGADTRPTGLEIADIFRRFGDTARELFSFSPQQLAVMRHIEQCRTQALGGHLDVCDHCGFTRPAYNSCHDRHCPKCQAYCQALWIAHRSERFLPTGHYHVVFTVPGLLRPLFRANSEVLFNALFRAASATLTAFAADPKWLGAQAGFTAVLHTWTRDLRFHPHVHCILTNGGLSLDATEWVTPKKGQRFLFPTKALAKVFRTKMLQAIRSIHDDERQRAGLPKDHEFERLLDRLHRMKWVVYAKAPFATNKHLVAYLGQYTHRVAISNHRLIDIDDNAVRFKTKDGKTESLPPTEFIRRFLDHILPNGFVKIRHYGLYASTHVPGRLEQARALLLAKIHPTPAAPPLAKPPDIKTMSWRELLTKLTGKDPLLCPQCGLGTMQHVEVIPPAPAATNARGPP